MAAATHLSCRRGEFELLRYPCRKQESLQAWSSADLLLLEIADASANTLVVNDEHGALCVPLCPAAIWTDSALAAAAIAQNCERNVQPMPALTWSTEKPGTSFDQVILRIPKLLPYFDYQLANLAAVLPAGVQLHCAGMDKHLSPQTAALIEKRLGNVERQRGQRKARVFSSVLPGPRGPIPSDFSAGYYCQQIDAQLSALPNVFSREKLDIGSRLLVDNLHLLEPAKSAADLACGNGLLGIAAMQLKLAQRLLFADESAMAIASARANANQVLGDQADIEFHLGDGLLGVPQKFELILCNPPFHLGHTVDDFAGRRLLQQAAAALLPGGSLLLVANRHLDYGSSLKHLFRNIDKLAQNNKFIVWRARHS
ncbi:MAG: methyltransferase [Halioglobus sp.]